MDLSMPDEFMVNHHPILDNAEVKEILTTSLAIGVDPATNQRMYFDNIHQLRDFIVGSYDYQRKTFMRVPSTVYLSLTVLSFDEYNVETTRLAVNSDGYIPYRCFNPSSNGYCTPAVNNIVIPQIMLEQYMGIYTKK